ncbi:hypothetical protein HK105_207338, partial [Polyrhizophydium stewartii]
MSLSAAPISVARDINIHPLTTAPASYAPWSESFTDAALARGLGRLLRMPASQAAIAAAVAAPQAAQVAAQAAAVAAPQAAASVAAIDASVASNDAFVASTDAAVASTAPASIPAAVADDEELAKKVATIQSWFTATVAPDLHWLLKDDSQRRLAPHLAWAAIKTHFVRDDHATRVELKLKFQEIEYSPDVGVNPFVVEMAQARANMSNAGVLYTAATWAQEVVLKLRRGHHAWADIVGHPKYDTAAQHANSLYSFLVQQEEIMRQGKRLPPAATSEPAAVAFSQQFASPKDRRSKPRRGPPHGHANLAHDFGFILSCALSMSDLDDAADSHEITFILDSGATSHFVKDFGLLHDACIAHDEVFQPAVGKPVAIKARGTVHLVVRHGQEYKKLTLSDVAYTPELKANLISEALIISHGFSIHADKHRRRIVSEDGEVILDAKPHRSHLPVIHATPIYPEVKQHAMLVVAPKSAPKISRLIAHQRLGHIGKDNLKYLESHAKDLRIAEASE